ncbi:hypothetical protein HDF26_005036 [Pedobacter cryoconitis]|uniref:Dual-action HEIGH metallo-peptidase n=1 Tax=Pedobacter cryoconitis TaxID=188932 RepID=A0A7W8ZLU9_9SPHI|nr:M57 family metalloprotease [Pedobacter cryoconitis]MBB5636386.1 hypothetical protein [Pedobacter cryoconitis]MBB6274558.1 hypothetical protein [Pedobacter cryoconitis]
MKTKSYLSLIILILGITVFISCKKNGKSDVPSTEQNSNLTKDEQSSIAKAGLSPEGAIKKDGGYLIEGDIFLTMEDLAAQQNYIAELKSGPKTEQYRSTNIVTGLPKVINVRVDAGASQKVFTDATKAAVKRYNDLGVKLTFNLLDSASKTKTDILINGANLGTITQNGKVYTVLGQSAGFPKNGNPATPIKLSNTYYNKDYKQNELLATVIAHEIGHAIGFRHTDYANRNYSCDKDAYDAGSIWDEGKGTDGAVLIPGTPAGADPDSWMLACAGSSSRPFTANDIIAIKALYPVK